MRVHHAIAALLCCSVLSTGVGFATAQLSQPDLAKARAGSSAVVKQLKTLNREVKSLSAQVGDSPFDTSSVFGTLGDIEHNTYETCQAVKSSFSC